MSSSHTRSQLDTINTGKSNECIHNRSRNSVCLQVMIVCDAGDLWLPADDPAFSRASFLLYGGDRLMLLKFSIAPMALCTQLKGESKAQNLHALFKRTQVFFVYLFSSWSYVFPESSHLGLDLSALLFAEFACDFCVVASLFPCCGWERALQRLHLCLAGAWQASWGCWCQAVI